MKNPPKLFYCTSLEQLVPPDNFYRILKQNLDLSFIYIETKEYYSHTVRPGIDPDARVAKKSNKPRMLCYSATMAVDTEKNVITHMAAEHSSKRDSRLLLDTVESTLDQLEDMNLKVDSVLADAGFSSGENYWILKNWKLKAYIPVHGSFKEKREGFEFDEKKNLYTCKNVAELKYKSTGTSGGYLKHRYISSKKDCDKCPFRKECTGKMGIKKIEHTIYREEYLEMIKRLKRKKGKESYKLRMQTVDPVFGSLQQYYGLRWINTRGIKSANKIMLMAASAFNLKKWVKHLTENGFFPILCRILFNAGPWYVSVGNIIFRDIILGAVFGRNKTQLCQAFWGV